MYNSGAHQIHVKAPNSSKFAAPATDIQSGQENGTQTHERSGKLHMIIQADEIILISTSIYQEKHINFCMNFIISGEEILCQTATDCL